MTPAERALRDLAKASRAFLKNESAHNRQILREVTAAAEKVLAEERPLFGEERKA